MVFKKSRLLGSIPEVLADPSKIEKSYWKCYKKPQIFVEKGPCVGAAVCADTQDVFVASSIRVCCRTAPFYDNEKSLLKLKDTVQSISVRRDGKLVAVGTSDGQVLVVDKGTKSVLRTLSGHKAAVKSLSFFPDKTHIVTGSDDKTVSLWDITTGSLEWTAKISHDFVRCTAVASDSSMFAAGSYDHRVNIWTMASSDPICFLDHGSPVEALLFFPNDRILATAGLSSIKIWNLESCDSPILLREIIAHHKTITGMAISPDGKYLISSSLDRSAKIIKLEDYSLVHQFKFKSAIMSLAVNLDCGKMVFGLSNGKLAILSFHPFKSADVLLDQKPSQQVLFSNDQSDALFVFRSNRKSWSKFDRLLRSFRYRKAFDELVSRNRADFFCAGISELIRRDALMVALSGKTDEELIPVLQLIFHSLANPKYVNAALEASFAIVDIYGPTAQKSPALVEKFKELNASLKRQISVQQEYLELQGQLNLLGETSLEN